MLLVAMVLLGLLAVVWTTRPLWAAAVEAGQRRRAANVAAYRQRASELEADRQAGLLDAETAVQLKAELDARLMHDAEGAEPDMARSSRAWIVSAVLGLLLLAGGFVGYFVHGSWRVHQLVAQGTQAGDLTPQSVEAMVAALDQRLQQNPNDVDGWALLGRSYFVMGRYVDAAAAYESGSRVVNDQEPDLLVNQGEALGMARDRDLLGKPAALFEAALALHPGHGKALWYAGLAARQGGDLARARAHWTALTQQEMPDELRQVLDEQLQMLDDGVVSPPAAAVPDPSGPADGAVLNLAVAVSPTLAERVPADAVLFVFARAADGPPMPLAVYRGRAAGLPQAVRLDDSMAMQPGMSLSAFGRWEVVARISRSGGAQAQPGDLEGRLTVARGEVGQAALELVIDRVVP